MKVAPATKNVRSLLPTARFRRARVQVTIRRDAQGFLLATISNNGRRIDKAEVTLSVRSLGAEHWIARVDPGGNPAMENGYFEHTARRVAGVLTPIVSWHESDVSLRGKAETEMRFFLGLAAPVDALEVIFGLHGSGSSSSSELSGTLGQLEAVELQPLRDPTAL